ncbi:MAG: hypothetical protein ACI82A_004131 [Candidatus Azotimanducaceae bacterium]
MKTRSCPNCKQLGIEIADIDPNGVNCLKCGALVEVDAMFNLLVTGFLAIMMILAFNYWNLDAVGFICGGLLIINAFSHKFINSHYMPLKYYEDDTSL